MNYLEELENRFQNENITFNVYPLQKSNLAFCMKFEKNYHIILNKNIKFNKVEKRCLLEHEYSHIKTQAFYSTYSTYARIKIQESKAVDDVIKRLELLDKVLPMFKEFKPNYEIADELCITEELVLDTLKYAKRKRLI